MKTPWIAFAACLLATACASSGPQSQLGTEAKAQKRIQLSRTSDCVFQRTIEDFQAIDSDHVVLYGPGRRKAYLAELGGGCFDMKGQSALAAVDGDRNGQICGFGRDSIAYRRMGRVEDCRIMALEQLSDERRMQLGVGQPPKPKKDDEKAEEPK